LLSNRRYIGIFLALTSGVAFMASNTLAGVSYQDGTNPLTVSATRFILPAVILFFLLKKNNLSVALPKLVILFSGIIGLITAIYTIALLSAIEILPFAIAILIFYLFPIITGLALAIMGWQNLTPTMVFSSVIAFMGIALALGIEFSNLNHWGIIYAGIAAAGLASVSVISNRLMVNEDARVVTLYLCTSATLVFIFICFFSGQFTVPKTNAGWISVATSHLFYAYATIAFYISISLIGAGETTFYINIEPIMAVAAGFLLLGQSLTALQYAGIFIVILALLYNGSKNSS